METDLPTETKNVRHGKMKKMALFAEQEDW